MKKLTQTTVLFLILTTISFGQERSKMDTCSDRKKLMDSIYYQERENVVVLQHRNTLERIVFKKGAKIKIRVYNYNIVNGKLDSIKMDGVFIKNNFIDFEKIRMIKFKDQVKKDKGTILVTLGGITTIVGVIVLSNSISKYNNADNYFDGLETAGTSALGLIATTVGVGLVIPGIVSLTATEKFDLVNEWDIRSEQLVID